MRARYEFTFHATDEAPVPSVDATLALMGSQGWEIRGIAETHGTFVVALQRPLDEDVPLPDAPTLAASLEEPLTPPVT